jgi:hypothetical protein
MISGLQEIFSRPLTWLFNEKVRWKVMLVFVLLIAAVYAFLLFK